MSKLIIDKPKFDFTKSREQNYADWINDHWGVPVARAVGEYVVSTLHRGVPLAATDQVYNHPDIIWVHIKDGKWQVRR